MELLQMLILTDRMNTRVRRPSFVNCGKEVLFENSSFNVDSFGSGRSQTFENATGSS